MQDLKEFFDSLEHKTDFNIKKYIYDNTDKFEPSLLVSFNFEFIEYCSTELSKIDKKTIKKDETEYIKELIETLKEERLRDIEEEEENEFYDEIDESSIKNYLLVVNYRFTDGLFVREEFTEPFDNLNINDYEDFELRVYKFRNCMQNIITELNLKAIDKHKTTHKPETLDLLDITKSTHGISENPFVIDLVKNYFDLRLESQRFDIDLKQSFKMFLIRKQKSLKQTDFISKKEFFSKFKAYVNSLGHSIISIQNELEEIEDFKDNVGLSLETFWKHKGKFRNEILKMEDVNLIIEIISELLLKSNQPQQTKNGIMASNKIEEAINKVLKGEWTTFDFITCFKKVSTADEMEVFFSELDEAFQLFELSYYSPPCSYIDDDGKIIEEVKKHYSPFCVEEFESIYNYYKKQYKQTKNLYLSDTSTVEKAKPKKLKKVLFQFIHNIENKEAFSQELKKTFPTEIGKSIKAVIDILTTEKILIYGTKEFKPLFEELQKHFNRDIGTYNSVQNVKIVDKETTETINKKLNPLIIKYKGI